VKNTEPDINQALEASWLSPEITNSETELLMHFLDVVFPLQYPMYRSGITEGGRGWLLSLLFHTKPLYHAALALSSYHRGSVLLAENYVGCHALAATEKESHLAICLADFRQSIKKVGRWVEESCPENVIGIMACVVQLVFFEVGVPKVSSAYPY
jgi:C6 transcription factor Pro1